MGTAKNNFLIANGWRSAIGVVMKRLGWRQEDLAAFLGIDPSTVSKMGAGWELHWQCFLKLLPYFTKFDVLTEHELHGHKDYESQSDTSGDKTSKIRTDSGKKAASVR